MLISVRNFRGIERADITVDPICLIAGKNFAGKSSIVQAVAAAVSGQGIPFIRPGKNPGEYNGLIPKKSAGALVRLGNMDAKVYVGGDSGTAQVFWPDAEVVTEGDKPPRSSVFAAGLIDPMDLDQKHRLTLLADLMGAIPDMTDLVNFLTDEGITKEKLHTRIWDKIEVDGWEATWDSAKTHGAVLKKQWEDTTGGEKYGSKKAEGWIPDNFDSDLEGESLEGLEAVVTKARKAVEKHVGTVAVDESEKERLNSIIAEKLPSLDDAKVNVAAAKATVDHAKGSLAKLPSIDADQQVLLACAHCGEPNVMVYDGNVAQVLVKPSEGPSEEAINARIDKRKTAQAEIDHATELMEGEESRLLALQRRHEDRNGAQARLEGAGEATEGSEKLLDSVREAARMAEERVTKFNTWTEAKGTHKSIRGNQIIIDALSPDGVRKVRLIRALDGFNKVLAALCNHAKWGVVEVLPDMDITLGGTSHIVLSDSERYRVKAAMQIAIAKMDGSDLVVLDGADILDKEGRSGLFKMILKWGGHALVAMTMNKPSQMPPLAKKGMGNGYWIESGLCVEPTDP